MLEFEGLNYCDHCGEELNDSFDEITIRDNIVRHTDCLPENLEEKE